MNSPQQHNIQKLDNDLINKIAAGEVVERPASVVKELLENSIDAGSTKITVSIRDGGRKLIQIHDNGCGIPPDQLELALARHATSKIREFDDVYKLTTKGFRGEALASISSVSQLTLSSKALDHDPCEIMVHAGEFIDKRACAHDLGTTVKVQHLFYQTPARLKFLRSKETESGHVADVVSRMALSHPDIEFKLYDEDRLNLHIPVCESGTERVVHILGRAYKDALYAFSESSPEVSIAGFVAHPQMARSQRSGAYFFVNGRSVNDKVIWHSVLEAHRDLLMKGKYPVIVLHVHVDEAALDVNVHPAKSEIRFHHPQQVHAFIKNNLRAFLESSPWIKQAVENFSETSSSTNPASFYKTDFLPNSETITQTMQSWSNRYFSEPSAGISKNFPQQKFEHGISNIPEQKSIRFGKTAYANMTPIGQLMGTYILCESADKMVLIDQHAAHERIGFEKLVLQHKQGGIVSEPLLIPETFDLKPSDAEILKHHLNDLGEFGLEVEFFGGNTFVVKAIPSLFRDRLRLQDIVADLIDDVRESGELTSLRDRLHHVFATLACHGQIRANHHLTHTEIQALLNELEHYQMTDFCPHGRPVAVEVTREEIEKWFRRIL